MNQTFPFFLQKFTGPDGKPLSGGKLYFYVAGSTSLPKNVYSDRLNANPITQPLVLDASGTAGQYFAEDGLYKVVLTDAAGAVIATRDYIEINNGTGGSVTSVTAQFFNGLETAMTVTSDPVTGSGAIAIDGVVGAPHKALMTPASGNGKPSMRTLVAGDIPDLSGSYLPLAGGTMASNATILWPNQDNVYAFDGCYWQAPDCWSRIAHWGAFWAPSTNPSSTRGGVELNPTGYGGYLGLKSPLGNAGVEVYTHEHGGYALFYDYLAGPKFFLGVNTAGHGEMFIRNYAGNNVVSASGYDGILNCVKLATGANTGIATDRVDDLGRAYFTSAAISGLTQNKLPRPDATGTLVDSAIGDDGTNVTCTRPLMVSNGKVTVAPAAAGYASVNIPQRTAAVTSPATGDIQADTNNLTVQGLGIISVKGASDTIGSGSVIGVVDSQTSQTKGWSLQLGASNDLGLWNYSGGWAKKIQFSSAGGIGFFGTAAPSSKPSVTGSRGGNAALASLLTALAAAGLITDSTTA